MRRLAALLVVVLGVLLLASPARADSHDDNPAGPLADALERGLEGLWNTATGDCPAKPPRIQDPESPLAGAFLEPPASPPPNRVTPDGAWAERGTAGLFSFTYDTGCVTPANTLDHLSAASDSDIANRLVGVSVALTAAADMVDRYSWDVDWLLGFFGDAATAMVEAFRLAFVLPFVAIGLLFTTAVLIWRAQHGATSAIALSVTWSAFVLAVMALVATSPLLLPRLTHEVSTGSASALYGVGGNPADAITDRTFKSVHWNGLLRRYFGEDPSPVALQTAPMIYESTGWTWEERAALNADPSLYEEMWVVKMQELDKATQFLKTNDPAEYADFTGMDNPRPDHAALELGYSASANLFRLASAALRVMCIAVLFLLGVLWLAATPALLTPHGESVGRGLLTSTVRALGFVVISIIGSFGFYVWSGVAMAPAVPTGLSLFMLIIGTILFWSLTRPDRKLVSLATLGHVSPTSKRGKRFGRKMRDALLKQALVAHAVKRGVQAGMDDDDRHETVASEEYEPPAPPPVVHEGYVVDEPEPYRRPAPGLPAQPTVIDGEVVSDYDTTYAREALPREPSPDRAPDERPEAEVVYGTEVEVYGRTVDA